MHRTPLDQGWQRAVEQPCTVVPCADAPAEPASRRIARCVQDPAAIDAQTSQRGNRHVDARHAGDELDRLWAVRRHILLQHLRIHVKPAGCAHVCCIICFGINSNHLKIGTWERRARNVQQPVVRAHPRMLATSRWRNPHESVHTRPRPAPDRQPIPPDGPAVPARDGRTQWLSSPGRRSSCGPLSLASAGRHGPAGVGVAPRPVGLFPNTNESMFSTPCVVPSSMIEPGCAAPAAPAATSSGQKCSGAGWARVACGASCSVCFQPMQVTGHDCCSDPAGELGRIGLRLRTPGTNLLQVVREAARADDQHAFLRKRRQRLAQVPGTIGIKRCRQRNLKRRQVGIGLGRPARIAKLLHGALRKLRVPGGRCS